MDCRRKRSSRYECARWNGNGVDGGGLGGGNSMHHPVGPFSGAVDSPYDRYDMMCPCECGCGHSPCRRCRPAPVPPCYARRHTGPPPFGCPCPDSYSSYYYACNGPRNPPLCCDDDNDKSRRNRLAYRNRQRRGGPNERFNECANDFFQQFGFDLEGATSDAEIERKLHLEQFMRAECGQWLDDCCKDFSKMGISRPESIQEGDILIYRKRHSVNVVKIYKDDFAPYFDVRLPNGQIIQTEARYLDIPPCNPPKRYNRSRYPHDCHF